MQIRLTIIKPLIIEAVKNETFLKGQTDKAATANASGTPTGGIALAYHEQAGDETYHERLIARSLATYVADFKSLLGDFLTANGQTSGDNIIETVDGDNLILTLSVSDRFNTSLTDALAKLASEYITNATLMDWWRPINERQSALYGTFLERNIASIRRCFNKTAPAVPTTPYTETLEITGSAVELAVGEGHTVTYTLSDGAIDDIEAMTMNKCICTIGRAENGFTLLGRRIGHAVVTIYSRHNPQLTHTINVYVTDHS